MTLSKVKKKKKPSKQKKTRQNFNKEVHVENKMLYISNTIWIL